MSDITYNREVVDKDTFKCDVCNQTDDMEKRAARVASRYNSTIDICKTCNSRLPEYFIEILKTKDDKWKVDAIRDILLHIYDSEDAMNYIDWTISDLKKGVWALFVNEEADLSEMCLLDHETELEQMALEMDSGYRHAPMELVAVLDNGQLKRFKIQRKLVEIKDDE